MAGMRVRKARGALLTALSIAVVFAVFPPIRGGGSHPHKTAQVQRVPNPKRY